MQVTLSHKGEVLTNISIATRLDVMLQMMQTHADQIGADLSEIEFDFTPSEEDTLPYVSLIFLVGEKMVIGTINTPEYSMQREFGVVEQPYTDKGEVVKAIVAEVSRAAHSFSGILQKGLENRSAV